MGLFGKLFQSKKTRYEIVRNEKGAHQIGGEVPADFAIPENEFIAGFQYLGYLDPSDLVLSWLPFKLNLIHPIYTDELFVYLDYTDPNSPVIMHPEDTASSTSAFDEIDLNSIILFEGVKVCLEQKEEIDAFESIGICGEPNWLQKAEIPICPKSGKPLKFVCQLGSFSDIKSTYTNVTFTEDTEYYFRNLNFWCDGNLYVFMEPETKTVCYSMQNT